MQIISLVSIFVASAFAGEAVLTQIGDGQIQAPTTTEETTVPSTTPAPSHSTTSTSTTPSEIPSSTTDTFEAGAPRAVAGVGAAVAAVAALLM